MNNQSLVADIASRGQLIETECGQGTMPFRIWPSLSGQNPENVVLLHGGSGAWNHWIRNIDFLSAKFRVIVPDLPGLGDSAMLDEPYFPQDAAGWVASGIKQVTCDQSYHLVAFSWGCVVAALVAAKQNHRVKSILLVGPASMGKMPHALAMARLLPRKPDMTEADVAEVNRENLARLMFFDRNKIDELAVHLQDINLLRSRFRSPRFANDTYVLDGLAKTTAPLYVIYGDRDAAAYPNIDTRRSRVTSVRPDVRFEILPDNGHWLQYESPELFNKKCQQWIELNSV